MDETTPETRFWRWLGVTAGSALVLLSVAAAAWVLQVEPRTEGGTPVASRASASADQEDDLVPPLARERDVLNLAQRSHDVLIGLAARSGGPVELVALPSGDTPVTRGSLRVTVGSDVTRALEPALCGTACFRLETPVLNGSPTKISIEITRPGKLPARVAFELPPRLPPPGDELLALVDRTWLSLRTLRTRESLSAGLGTVIRARYQLQAPDRVSLETAQGQRTILIGDSRWDWQGGRWIKAPFPGLEGVPNRLWEGTGQPRLLGEARIGAVPVRVLALFTPDPERPIWFRLFVAPGGQVLETEMLTQAHFMVQRYSGFNEPFVIEPPV